MHQLTATALKYFTVFVAWYYVDAYQPMSEETTLIYIVMFTITFYLEYFFLPVFTS